MKTGVIIVDHGSRFDAANQMLETVVERVRARGIYEIVEVAHMEIARPSIEEAFNACVRAGAERVVVHPYFLSPGRHSQTDIPRMASDAAAKHAGIRVVVTEPLGLDERLIDVVLNRVQEALRMLGG